MKKFIIYFLGILIGSTLLFSCKKSFLDEQLKSTYAPQNVLKDSLGFDAAATGLVWQFRQQWSYGWDGANSNYQGLICCMYVGTDVCWSNSQAEAVQIPFGNYALLTSASVANLFYWQWAYKLISNANFVIQAVQDSAHLTGMSSVYRKSIEGEAKFFRAYGYNLLSTLWGDVPIVTSPVTAPTTNYVRSPVSDVLNLMITDLQFAETYCRDMNYIQKIKREGRICNSAASQLLAEVYIRAGKPDLAVIECDKVINSGIFKLTTARYGVKSALPGDPFSDMFLKGNQRYYQGNKEAIWVIDNDFNVTGGNPIGNPGVNNQLSDQHRRVWVPRYININDGGSTVALCDSLGGRGIGRMRLTNWVCWNLYEPTDMRNSKFNIRRTMYYSSGAKKGLPVDKTKVDTTYMFCPYTTKWNDYNPSDPDALNFASYKDYIMMRLGETYLLKAEALFKQGLLQNAADALNVLRSRAGATPALAANITMDYILDERARELLAEENRRATLVRTGTLVDRVTKLAPNGVDAARPINIQSYNALLPIPLNEINLNKDAVLTQNPGY